MIKRYQKIVMRIGKKLRNLDRKYVIGISLVSFIGIFFFHEVISAFIAMILFIIGCLSTIYRRFIPLKIGFEVMTFVTVLYCFAYNPSIAWLLGMIMTFIGAFVVGGNSSGIAVFVKMFTYAVMVTAFYALEPMGIVTGGIIMVVIYNLLTRTAILFFGANPVLCVAGFFINITVNSYMLVVFGTKLLALMA